LGDHPVTRGKGMTKVNFNDRKEGLFGRLPREKQERIIDAAVEEFSEKGYRAASMNSLVRRAGISKGALFKYFGSKSILFGYIYELTLERIKKYLREVRDSSRDEPFSTRMEKVMQAGVKFITGYPRLARIYYNTIHTGETPFKRSLMEEIQAESFKYIRSFIEDGIRREELRPDVDPDKAAFALVSVMDRYLQAHQLEFTAPSLRIGHLTEEEEAGWIREMVNLFQRGMVRDEKKENS
jgi:AcrR family transcriptional regulator